MSALKFLKQEWKFITKAVICCFAIVFLVMITFIKSISYIKSDMNVVETEQIINDNRNTDE